jgi:cell division protein FtsN
MTDQDRGAYTPPTDQPLSFDARQPVRGSRPVPLTLIASGFVLILLIGAIVLFYRSGVRQAGEGPAALGQPVTEMKSPPPPDSQPQDPAAGLQIYKSETGRGEEPVAPTFTAPPESPAPRPAPSAAPVQTAELPPALKPAQPVEAKPAPPPKPAAAAPKAAPAAPASPKPAAPAAASGRYSVQIGAFSSQAQADKGFADAGRITGVDIAGKGKKVEPIKHGGSTLYRTSVTGFASQAQAQAFCGQLKAAGKACFVK